MLSMIIYSSLSLAQRHCRISLLAKKSAPKRYTVINWCLGPRSLLRSEIWSSPFFANLRTSTFPTVSAVELTSSSPSVYYSCPASTSLHPPHGCVQTFVFHRYMKWAVRPVIVSPIIQTQNHLVSNSKYETARKTVHFMILTHRGWAFLENATRNSFLITFLIKHIMFVIFLSA